MAIQYGPRFPTGPDFPTAETETAIPPAAFSRYVFVAGWVPVVSVMAVAMFFRRAWTTRWVSKRLCMWELSSTTRHALMCYGSSNSRQMNVWVVVSNIFYFHPYLGKIPNLTNIFQMGWNRQLDVNEQWWKSVFVPLLQYIQCFSGPAIASVSDRMCQDASW